MINTLSCLRIYFGMQEGGAGVHDFDIKEMAKTAVPATLYVVQNNLAYLAISNLDAVCRCVCMFACGCVRSLQTSKNNLQLSSFSDRRHIKSLIKERF